jgi:NADH-quinone oxidoreductase subunit H
VSETLLFILIVLIKMVIVAFGLMIIFAFTTVYERKLAGFIQDRLGPNRVGPFGIFQVVADGIKMFMKEEVIPNKVNKPLYLLAPLLFLAPSLMIFAVVPFGEKIRLFGQDINLVVTENINIGILFVFAFASLGVYGIITAGWASNNKFSVYSSLRSAAQMISYEVILILACLPPLMAAGSLNLKDVVNYQAGLYLDFIPRWNLIIMLPGAVIFFIAMLAELNRLPFDMVECEQELVAGVHLEYSSMKFAAFYMGEYMNMLTSSMVFICLFLGGWLYPGYHALRAKDPNLASIISIIVFGAKLFIMVSFIIHVRWTLPRFRYDQLMNLCWKRLLPAILIWIFIVAVGLLVLSPDVNPMFLQQETAR